MDGRLLDTNAVTAIFNADPALRSTLANRLLLIPSIVVGELYYGAYNSTKVSQNLARLHQFVTQNTTVACDAQTGQHFGEIKTQLKQKGRPIPDNDIWIAAIARQYGLVVVTRDAHFKEIDGLIVESW